MNGNFVDISQRQVVLLPAKTTIYTYSNTIPLSFPPIVSDITLTHPTKKKREMRESEETEKVKKMKKREKMKHIFKKLHIGSSNDPTDNQRAASENSPASPTTTTASSSPVTATTVPVTSSTGLSTPSSTVTATNRASDYMLSEEEFQVQLALAISASNSEDPKKDQIRETAILSLGSHHRMDLGIGRDKDDVAAEFLARQYWVSVLFLCVFF